jgi:hypothetical protein
VIETKPHELCHTATALVDAPPDLAFAFAADPARVGEWTLGSFAARPAGGGVFHGRALTDDSTTAFRAAADRDRRIVDYHVGAPGGALVMRIGLRVLPGDSFGYGVAQSLVSMFAWRPAGFDDQRWRRTIAFHDAEIILLKGRIERAARDGG